VNKLSAHTRFSAFNKANPKNFTVMAGRSQNATLGVTYPDRFGLGCALKVESICGSSKTPRRLYSTCGRTSRPPGLFSDLQRRFGLVV